MPDTKRPLKVFLCHASLDKPKVRELYRYLRRRGIRPWFDEVDLIGGQDWQVEIPKALATSDAIIICLTKNSVDKEGYVQKEIKFALDKALEMPEGRIYLVPIRFEECEVPHSLSRFQWVDLFEQNGFPRLMKSLKTRAAQLERANVQVPRPYEVKPELSSTSRKELRKDTFVPVVEQNNIRSDVVRDVDTSLEYQPVNADSIGEEMTILGEKSLQSIAQASVLVIGLGGTGIKTLLHVKKRLLDQSVDGKLPSNVQILGLDTVSLPERVKGTTGTSATFRRGEGLTYVNQVDLVLNEDYLYIGGDTYPWVCGNKSPRWGENHYTRYWFDRNFFCNDPGAAALLNIENGVGQFRQVGRLAFFYALRPGFASNLYQTIRKKLARLGRNVRLIVCGSLAGGTGASIWIDVAHLVHNIAESMDRHITANAMLALPGAFEWTWPGFVNNSMKARSMAAMREMCRFMGVVDENLGFEMRYAKDNQKIFVARTRGTIYRRVYLYETRDTPPGKIYPPNPLNVKIEYGLAPTMATWILALADPQSSSIFDNELANRDNHLVNALSINGVVPIVCGSTGTYSIILPVGALIEEWAIRLAIDVLNAFLSLTGEGSANPAKLGGDPQREAFFSAADWEQNPVPIAKDAGNMGIDYQPGRSQQLIRAITERGVHSWQAIFLLYGARPEQRLGFESMQEDKVFFYNEKQKGLFRNPLNGALLQEESPKAHNDNSESAAKALVDNCEGKEQAKLAEWSRTVQSCVDDQLSAYQQWLQELAISTLNGKHENIPANAFINRTGKVGWLLKYVSDCAAHLDAFCHLLEEALYWRKSVAESKLRSIGEGVLLDMQLDPRKQREYLKARQQILDYHRWELLSTSELSAVRKMQAYTAYLRDELHAYITNLGGVHNSVIRDLEIRRDQVRASRQEGNELDRVRELVKDQYWEDAQYAEYTMPEETGITAIQRMLTNFEWDVEETTINPGSNEARDIPKLTLRVKGFPLKPHTILDRDVIEVSLDTNDGDASHANRASGNAQRILAGCRQNFERAWDALTIMDYLAYRWDGTTPANTPQAFAEYLMEKCDVLLSLPRWGQHLRWFYLLRPEVQNHSAWQTAVYNTMMYRVAASQGWGGVVYHGDKTTFTYIATADFIDIQKLDTYQNGLKEYFEVTAKKRSLLHVFHAEQRAVDFDTLMPDGRPVLIPPRVVAILEEDARLHEFITALALGMIIDDVLIEGNHAVGYVKQVRIGLRPGELDPITGLPVETQHIWIMNDPNDFKSDQVPYLIAAETFCFRTVDYSKHPRSLDDMRSRLSEEINQKVEELLKMNYEPKWKEGQGSSSGIAAFNMPAGRLRNSKLLNEVRKELYLVLSKSLLAYESQVGMLDGADSPSRLIEMVKPDEIAFVKVLIRQIGIWLQQ